MQPASNSELNHRRAAILISLFAAALALGIVVSDDYGMSWDEPTERVYAEDALRAYRPPGLNWQNYEFRRYYGPSYLMTWAAVSSWLGEVLGAWDEANAGHFINYLSFLFAIGAFFIISRLYLPLRVTLFTTALFATQPLLFGHAFINHKDQPFMALFLGAVAFGLAAIERAQDPSTKKYLADDRSIAGASQRKRAALAVTSIFFLVLIIDQIVDGSLLFPPIASTIEAAYGGESLAFINNVFLSVAQNAPQIPLANYLNRAAIWFGWLRLALLGFSMVILSILFWRVFPEQSQSLQKRIVQFRVRFDRRGFTLLFLSALCAGLAASSRILGPFAALLVVIVLLAEKRWAGVLWSGLYLLLIGLITILAWPYLWSSPIANYLASLSFFANHPWQGTVLYAGQIYDGSQMPWHYLPRLFSFQITEPALILAVTGFVILVLDIRKKRGRSMRGWLLVFWIFVPLLATILRPTKIFDNFRQFLFVVPALLLLSGLGMRYVLGRNQNHLAAISLFGLALLPGLVAIVRLHPYEYVYYNAHLNGLPGARSSYELDYWCTAFGPAVQYINKYASANASVSVFGPPHTARYYARPDLTITRQHSRQADDRSDWLIICSRSNWADTYQPDGEPTWQIERLGVPLGAVWQLEPPPDG